MTGGDCRPPQRKRGLSHRIGQSYASLRAMQPLRESVEVGGEEFPASNPRTNPRRLLSGLDAAAMPLDFRHQGSIFTIRVQAFESFAQSYIDGRIAGIPVSRVQQHTRLIPV
jgi:hypothetical protein